ncbi:hypothetical protein FE783_20965 [Paenibacillus mesophilus]|uniref:hypothetical protein n=1 Tax=Paenibacillus mesophilus TaxID=2582849 RepID=UPI00110F6498|nr:hypothetical protein [Paenibacillus mesophilus]TMV47475.1 hypothetical protein FE783_20965 [Paenibacillus mesophilus]
MANDQQTAIEKKRFPYRVGDTDIILGADKEKHGLASLRRPEAGFDLVREPYFALNLYRIMFDRRLQGIARYEPIVIKSQSERGLVLEWEPTDVNPCRMEAAYEIVDESTIDLTVSIEAFKPMSKYEITVSSYFDFAMEPYAIIPKWPAKTDSADMLLHKVEDHPLIKGHYVYLPRDNEAGHTRLDGRWLNEKTGLPIAPFVTGPFYGRAVAVMGTGDLHVVQMADPAECGAVGVTYSSLEENDSIRKHNALYFTLFGGDLAPGDRRTARMRQVTVAGEAALEQTLDLYEKFMGQGR